MKKSLGIAKPRRSLFPASVFARTLRERVTLLGTFALQTFNLWRIDLGYTLLWWALLLWASLNPDSFWFAGTAAALPASQVICACAILTPFFIPFVVYFPVTQIKGHLNSFSSIQLSSSKTTRGYLKQVLVCSLLTFILSELVTGTRFESHLVSFVQRLGESTQVSIFLLLSSLLAGSFFSAIWTRAIVSRQARCAG